MARFFGKDGTRNRWTVLLLVSIVFVTFSASAQNLRTLHGHLPDSKSLTRPVGALQPEAPLHLAISLPFRNTVALTNLLRDLYDPASPRFHQFLTPQQFNAQFGPTAKDYEAVVAFAKANGLTISATHGNRALLEVDAPVAKVEKAFHVHMRQFQHPTETRTFIAPDTEPTIASNVPILFVGGLNSFLVPRAASLHVTPMAQGSGAKPNAGSVNGSYAGLDFRAAYAPGVTNLGTGQSIGLVEFDSYYEKDVTDYLTLPQTGLSNSSVTLSNINLGIAGGPGAGNIEVALDIDMAISMAPGLSTVYVYEAPNTSTAADSILNRIVSDNLPRQISCSWSGFDDATIEQDLMEISAQGQSFFQASGDSGAYFANNPVPPPCDNPYITVVGGATLKTSGPRGGYSSETAWNWFTTPFNGLSNNATSGGISPTWTIPSWQTGVATEGNQASTSYRNLPDVAMAANDIFIYADNGMPYVAGGTSAATPLWAGISALLNQERAAQGQSPEGFYNPALYALAQSDAYASCFHDITVGNNTNYVRETTKIAGSDYTFRFDNPDGFFAQPGYDLCTGWGSPDAAGLIKALATEPSPTATSTPISPTTPPRILTITAQADGTKKINMSGAPGATYVVEASDVLTGAPWTPIATNTAAADGSLFFIDPGSAGAVSRFYRLRGE